MLNKNDASPLFEQLEELIRSWIEAGKYKPGDRIPSEFELAETHNISRITVRRALDRLVMEGVIFRKQGKGAFVSSGKVDYNPTTLFSFSTAMKALGHHVRTQIIDQKIIPAPKLFALNLNLPEKAPVIFIRRLRFIDDQPATLHRSYLPVQFFEGILTEDLTDEPLTRVMEKVSGLTITRSSDSFEAALVRPDEAQLLGINKNTAVLLVRGVAFSQTGIPVRSTSSVYRGDLFRFQINPGTGLTVHFNNP